jgi:V/A-type H+-transporting ATPase subunit D
MAEIKLTKNELRAQQIRLGQLEKYLPTLQLKKMMLQGEVNEARIEILKVEEMWKKEEVRVQNFSALLTEIIAIDLTKVGKVKQVHKHYDNIAGVEVPYFDSVDFEPVSYNLFDTPPWVDSALASLRALSEAQIRVNIAVEKKEALEKELRDVSIRVNLFEKILIPRAQANIRKIKVFLGDMQLQAVSQAKVAKAKIIERKEAAHAH